MSKPFKLLKEKMSPEARQAAEKKTKQLLREMLPQELRHSRNVNQEQFRKK